jgi:hypothetical protein
MMRISRSLVLGGGLLVALAAPAAAQQTAKWQDMWFWGAQGGVLIYQTAATAGSEAAFTVGGHWLITGRRSGLYLSYDQIIFDNKIGRVPDGSSPSGTRDVQFDNGRLVQGSLVAIPIDGNFQVIAGAGVTLYQISDPVPQGTFASAGDQEVARINAEQQAMRAFWNLMGGFQFQLGGRFAIFGHYQFMPSARNFLITSETHSFFGGIRLALSGRKEAITTQN